MISGLTTIGQFRGITRAVLLDCLRQWRIGRIELLTAAARRSRLDPVCYQRRCFSLRTGAFPFQVSVAKGSMDFAERHSKGMGEKAARIFYGQRRQANNAAAFFPSLFNDNAPCRVRSLRFDFLFPKSFRLRIFVSSFHSHRDSL